MRCDAPVFSISMAPAAVSMVASAISAAITALRITGFGASEPQRATSTAAMAAAMVIGRLSMGSMAK